MRLLRSALLCILAGCAADRIASSPVTAELLTNQAWSGGRVRLVVQGLAHGAVAPQAVIGVDTVPAAWEGDSILSVPVPDTNGLVALGLLGAPPLPSIVVHGFREYQETVPVDGYLQPWPRPGMPTALALHGGQAARIDFRLGTAVPLGPITGITTDCLAMPTPSVDDPTILVTATQRPTGACDDLLAWRMGTGAPVDTGPPAFYYWPAMRLGAGRWLVSYKSYLVLFSRASNGTFTVSANIPCNKPTGFRASPIANRVIPVGCTPVSGPTPVFDPATASIAAYAPGAVASAAFSPSGAVLYVAIPDDSGTTLHALAADDGHILTTAHMREATLALEADESGTWLFAAAQADTVPIIRVFETQSLAYLATLRRPVGTSIPLGEQRFYFMNWQLLSSGPSHELFLVFGGAVHPFSGVVDAPTFAYRFSLLDP